MQRVDVYDPTLTRIGAIYSWVSLVWTDSYNEGGSFQLETVPSAELRTLLAPDNLLRFSETGTMMVVTALQIETETMLATGNDAAHLLASRVTTADIAPSSMRGGTTVAETAIRNAFTKYIGTWDILDAGSSAGINTAFEETYSADELESVIQGIAQEADMGYRLNFDAVDKKLVLECYYPSENSNLIYSPKYRNIGDVVYTESYKDYKNVCIVLNSDGGIAATVGETSATGNERREMIITDSSDSSTETQYKKEGQDALAKQANLISLDCNITGGAELGDIINIRIPEIGISLKKRIKQISITAQGGGVDRTYTIGDVIKVQTATIIKRGGRYR